uniref:Uncharacterized protein n=1 Tax=Anguilla anguilla TaxID=7936 RepID=A0A0E9X2X8_ANGAN
MKVTIGYLISSVYKTELQPQSKMSQGLISRSHRAYLGTGDGRRDQTGKPRK